MKKVDKERADAVAKKLHELFDTSEMTWPEFRQIQKAIGRELEGPLTNRTLATIINRTEQWFSRQPEVVQPETATLMRLLLRLVLLHRLNRSTFSNICNVAEHLSLLPTDEGGHETE